MRPSSGVVEARSNVAIQVIMQVRADAYLLWPEDGIYARARPRSGAPLNSLIRELDSTPGAARWHAVNVNVL